MRTRILLTLLFSTTLASFAKDAPLPLVQVTIISSSGTKERRLEAVLRSSIDVALSQRGFSMIDKPPSAAGSRLIDFQLTVRYSFKANHASMLFSLTDTRGSMLEEKRTLEQSLDMQFDQGVSSLVVSMLSVAEKYLVERLPLTSAEPIIASDAIGKRDSRKSIGLGMGYFFPIGDAMSYFSASAQIQATISFPFKDTSRWAASITATVLPFSIDGPNSLSINNLITMLGAEIRYDLLSVNRLSVRGSVAAGPAFVFIEAEGTSTFVEFMPYASAEISAGLRISERIGINVGISSTLLTDFYTVPRAILWGVTPILSITMEL